MALPLTSVSQRDRTLAAGMHLATIFAPLVAPIVAWGVFRDSPFVSAHARRSLTGALMLQGALFILGLISLAYTVSSLYGHYQTGWTHFSLLPILAKAAIVWAVLSILELVNAVAAIRAALRAYRGQLC